MSGPSIFTDVLAVVKPLISKHSLKEQMTTLKKNDIELNFHFKKLSTAL